MKCANMTEIYVDEVGDTLTLTIKDDGCGMNEETVKSVVDPFYTTRTTRKVGLGIPLLKLACEQTGGTLSITSSVRECDHGTTVTALFHKNHIDFTPLGDVISTVTTLIQGHPEVDFVFSHKTDRGTVSLDTRELRVVLEDVPLDTFEVLTWIKGNLEEQYSEINK